MFKKSEKDSVENDTVNSDSEEKNTVESESEKLQENASEENDVDVREKKKLLKKLKNKFVTGVLCGVTFTLIITFGSAYIYSYATGRYFVFKANNKMRVGNEILDNKSMDKINELRTYMDLYYFHYY